MRLRPRLARCSTASTAPPSSSGSRRERVGIVGLGEDVDDRQAVGERPDRRALVGAARGHHQPVDALAQQLVEMLALARRIVGGVAHEDGDALVGEPLLERLDDREGEAAETVVGDDADGARLGAMQALREVVRPVADLAGDAQHLVARLLPQPAAGVERLRRRADRHLGDARDVADGRRAARWRSGLVGRDRRRDRPCPCGRLFHRAVEEAGDVVFLQQQVERHAGDDRDRDACLQHAPVGAADARLWCARWRGPAAA